MLSRPICGFRNAIQRYKLPANHLRRSLSTPSALRISYQRPLPPCKRTPQTTATRNSSQSLSRQYESESSILSKDPLPICCPGCGAYAQTIDPNEPGYYSKTRRKTRMLPNKENGVLEQPSGLSETRGSSDSGNINPKEKTALAPRPAYNVLVDDSISVSRRTEAARLPARICDRCHNLIHHNRGVSAPSPTIDTIRALLDESPHECNRVYHILDAADFPMSLIPGICKTLSLQKQRSRNRRAKTVRYKSGKRMTTIDFIVTRSDLLAATKDQVDSKMSYIRSILLDALKIKSEDVRLGNVHMISAHRGWWTKHVKEEIGEHGGGVWVVGKVNVGKSSFIETCFPKNSKSFEGVEELLNRRQEVNAFGQPEQSLLDSDSLLPPAPPDSLYPVLPVVSPLPGTTVSPIRIPFGRGKGEMIDLPGLDRETLEEFVRDDYKANLLMTKRVCPENLSIQPGQSLLLGGGLIRITPIDPEDVVLAACFLPLETHVTNTQKAVEIQARTRPYSGIRIMKEGVCDILSSAGIFELKWDITRSHLPTTMKKRLEDQGIQPPSLPYRVMSTDILVEGCGWIEFTAQIRTKGDPGASNTLPRLEVFSPNGGHIGFRPPIQAWEFIAQKKISDKRKLVRRPRRQNISQKKRAHHSTKL